MFHLCITNSPIVDKILKTNPNVKAGRVVFEGVVTSLS